MHEIFAAGRYIANTQSVSYILRILTGYRSLEVDTSSGRAGMKIGSAPLLVLLI